MESGETSATTPGDAAGGLALVEGRDFYWDAGLMVLTERYLRERGTCCRSGCRHCPYDTDREHPTPDAG